MSEVPEHAADTEQVAATGSTTGTGPTDDDGASILSSSAVMAAGTVVSRVSGFVRSGLLAAALGTQLHADVFTIANTVPNMLYILLAGGIFNAVLVPQLVRALKNDADGGDAYTNRVVTLAALFLAGVTVLLVAAAPLLMHLFLGPAYYTPELSAQRESLIDFARLCLPQVFFYGMFVLVGQVLNSRRSFGPMMWAPIANNVISIAVLVAYLLLYGSASGSELTGGFTSGQELLLGLGSTVGIAVQLLILLPFLRRAGFTIRPRFDFRGTGLGHTLRLGMWTVLFVIVNQVAYTVVVRIASTGTADAATSAGGAAGAGYTVYSYAFLVMMVPHAIVTVSLATAMLPRLSAHAADEDLRGVGSNVAETLRTALALIVPVAVLFPLVANEIGNLVWGYGAARSTYQDFAVALSLFAPGLVFFTAHYLMLRGFYALERTRTVFWVQCVIAATNIALALLLGRTAAPQNTAAGLVLAYGGAYLVGSAGSYLLLRHVLGGLETPQLARFLARLLPAVALAGAAGWLVRAGLRVVWAGDGKLDALVTLVTVTLVGAVVYLAASRALRLREVTAITSLVTSRLRR
ncbi:murein biosynthesis integral membrane protein MurJ [Nocardioides mesophilus]|uniref:Murein biosynthesis integral membrane protein MurJ n=1 Tax=Nocardioides mesophilus TaxID=433659 RepID=A0A7G9RFQ6_9ACTN|nr:murein biosynthesis integral membrane protein MurJ [Nocardioides mesophilus]QNN54431.1 murein biosynthesis integral membrane protein MurJ [Nocardioides mesophilus]